LAETKNEKDGMDIMNYESDSDQSRRRTSMQKGFERGLNALAAKPEPDYEEEEGEEEEDDDVSVCVGMHFSFDMGIVSFANRSISFIYHSIRTSYVTERRGVECRRRTT